MRPATPPLSRILIRRSCALGDLILSLPFLCALRQRYPSAQIHFLGSSYHVPFLEEFGFISKGFSETGSGWHFLYSGGEPRGDELCPDPREYDICYLFVSNPRGSPLLETLTARLGVRLRTVPARPPLGQAIHTAAFFLRHLRHPVSLCEIMGESGLHSTRIPSDVVVPRSRTQREAGTRSVMVHPGSGSRWKNWPVERFAALLRNAAQSYPDIGLCILKGPGDRNEVSELIRQTDGLGISVHQCKSLVELVSCLRGTCLLVGNDSGVNHLAAFLGIPTITIFGPSDPVQWSPLGPRAQVLFHSHACHPCHLKAGKSCPNLICSRFPQVRDVQTALHGFLACG